MRICFKLKCDFEDPARLWAELEPLLLPRYSQDSLIRIRIGLVELINNIIEHGYGCECDQIFALRCFNLKGGLIFVMSHHGQAAIAAPPPAILDADEALSDMSERGRGLWLIEQCFRKVRYTSRARVKRVIALF